MSAFSAAELSVTVPRIGNGGSTSYSVVVRYTASRGAHVTQNLGMFMAVSPAPVKAPIPPGGFAPTMAPKLH
jgi:hypothetical protein